MRREFVKIPKPIEKRDEYPDGANWPTQITVYPCFCKKGTIEHQRVPGFGDDFYTIECPICEETYDYIEACGREWIVYRSDGEPET